jgi:hypothetical protein
MITLRSMIAHLATMIRYAGIAYIAVQVAIWHSFYAESPWRAAAPALAVAWATAAALYLRRHPPSELFTGADTIAYLALALAAQGGVPPDVRDSAFSWLVIAMSGQLIVPAWYAAGPLAVLFVLASPLAYLAGAELRPVTDVKMMTGAAILLLAVGLVHGCGRRVLYGRAAPGADAEDPGRLRIAVRDRGAGFDLARVDQARLGLRRSITERIAECGGQASVWSAPGQGTEVSLCWPAPDRAGYSGDGYGLAQGVLPW